MEYKPGKIEVIQAQYYTKKLTNPEPWRELQFCEWVSDGKGRVREQWRDVAREPTWVMAEYRWRPETEEPATRYENEDYPLDGKSVEQELEEEIQRHDNAKLFKKAWDEPSKKTAEELVGLLGLGYGKRSR